MPIEKPLERLPKTAVAESGFGQLGLFQIPSVFDLLFQIRNSADYAVRAPSTSDTLVPPKPREFDSAYFIFRSVGARTSG